MLVAVPKEIRDGEKRVALVPDIINKLTRLGLEVVIESGAGIDAQASDDAYRAAGAQVVAGDVLKSADVVLSVTALTPAQIATLKKGAITISFLSVVNQRESIDAAVAAGVTAFSLELVPRISRAQSMDALTSQALCAGYRASLVGAELSPRFFPMLMTAAGTVTPAQVLVLGAGVAGLQAIATAKRLGSVVEVFDTRPAVKEEVQSLGAKFIEIPGAADASSAGGYAVEQSEEYKRNQQQKIAESIAKADIVITTAQIPGKKAPILVTEEMLKTMREGSVIVDLAASTGGNTPHTKNLETVVYNGVKIIGDSNLPATMPSDASKLYGKNIINFLLLITDKEGNLHLNMEDDLVKGARAQVL